MDELRPYQIAALDQMVEERRLIYGDPIGSGKTATSLSALPALGSERALVLVPSYLLDQWVREGQRWVPGVEMILGAGTAARREAARARLADAPGPAALVLNYESAWRDVDHLLKLKFDTLLADEAHRLKNRKTATFKQVAKLARRADNLILITGTPILNRADEMWSALHLIDHQRHSSYWNWVKLHFDIEMTDFHGKVSRPIMLVGDLKPGHLELIQAELGPRLIQRQDVIQLPPLVENTIHVTLSPAERKAYDEMKRRSWTRVEGDLIQTTNEAAKTTRLRQMASEWGALSAGLDDKVGAKVGATVALVEDLLPEPVIVVAQYQETVKRIAKELDAPFICGTLDTPQRQIVLDSFKAGETGVIVATQGVISEGIDGLQDVCHTIVMVDRDWTPARNDQTLGRLRRSGQADTVHAYYIVAEDTIDSTVAEALESKRNVIDAVLGGLEVQ